MARTVEYIRGYCESLRKTVGDILMKPKGRPSIAKDGEKMRNRNFRATDAEWARCLELGGGSFLRAKIKAAKVGHNVKLRGDQQRTQNDE